MIGVDVDSDSLQVAQSNLEETEAEVDLILSDVVQIGERFQQLRVRVAVARGTG